MIDLSLDSHDVQRRSLSKNQEGGHMNLMAMNKVLEPKEVAQMLRVSVRTITRLAERGELSGFKVGDLWRFYQSDVEAYVEAQRRKQQGR